ncbi:MAG: hypothetical protein OD815_000501 [Candidatus Alkanophagales archaeon MCA70_species_2]|nr:hypothetical protein [Candidatus Alkanophaga liquidiphilum]
MLSYRFGLYLSKTSERILSESPELCRRGSTIVRSWKSRRLRSMEKVNAERDAVVDCESGGCFQKDQERCRF